MEEVKKKENRIIGSIILSIFEYITGFFGSYIGISFLLNEDPETTEEAIGFVFLVLLMMGPTILLMILSLIFALINMIVLLKRFKNFTKGQKTYSIITFVLSGLLILLEMIIVLLIII